MQKIKINKEKCIKCGACIKDCITYSLEKDSDGYAKVSDKNSSLCISCQHCFSICPSGAISFNDNTPENISETSPALPENVLDLIKTRRSIRQYKNEEISEELLKKIKEMLPYVPTGCNYKSLHFSIIESKTAMDSIRKYVTKKLLKIISNKLTQKYAGKFTRFKTAFENGEDVIFRNAPHMIVVSSNIKAPCANVDPIIALSYIELYAHSFGLGTCWCGFAQACFKLMPKLSKMIDIPSNYKPVYVMLLGYPSVKYPRIPLPEEFPITEITSLAEEQINFWENIKRVLINFIR
jgi:nitroreductase/NAD-dependent dihydropyrimidine dehydrogenase PreA subunit